MLNRQLRHWHPKKPECVGSFKSFNIGMAEVYPPFVLLLIGATASMLVLAVELVVVKWEKKKISPIKPFAN